MQCLCFFLFQAKDGIRDLVRSRGLGDVYKRQADQLDKNDQFANLWSRAEEQTIRVAGLLAIGDGAVSYTHLTLPTSDLV